MELCGAKNRLFLVVEREYRRLNATKVPPFTKNKFLDQSPHQTAKITPLDVAFLVRWWGGLKKQAGRSRDAYRSSCAVD
jgi:hypothetical protein